MKRYLVLLVWLAVVTTSALAQLPQKAEDISPKLNGEKIPETLLRTPDGDKEMISRIIKERPTVLLFYRGGWCPYCNAHLSEIQKAESEVLKLGYQIVAISPDSPENLRITSNEHQLNYRLYSDANGEFIKALGIAFKAPEKYSGMLSKRSNEKNEGVLLVPSVFVVDKEGKILFEYINPDYKTRLSAGLLLSVLKELKSEY